MYSESATRKECKVCFKSFEDGEPFAECQGCGVTVHGPCYGSKFTAQPRKNWLCKACKPGQPQYGNPSTKARTCAICKQRKPGAFKSLTRSTSMEPMEFVHLVCARMTPMTYIHNTHDQAPIEGMEGVNKYAVALQKSKCAICSQSYATLKCRVKDCLKTFHPICIMEKHRECVVEQTPVPLGPIGDKNVAFHVYCPEHRQYHRDWDWTDARTQKRHVVSFIKSKEVNMGSATKPTVFGMRSQFARNYSMNSKEGNQGMSSSTSTVPDSHLLDHDHSDCHREDENDNDSDSDVVILGTNRDRSVQPPPSKEMHSESNIVNVVNIEDQGHHHHNMSMDTFDTAMDDANDLPFASPAPSAGPGGPWMTRSGSLPWFNDNQSLPDIHQCHRETSMDPIYFHQNSVTPMEKNVSLQSVHPPLDLKSRYLKNSSFEETYPQSKWRSFSPILPSDHSVDNTTVNTVMGGSVSSNTIFSTSPNEERCDLFV